METTSFDRFVREPERRHITGVGRTAWFELERAGKAPKRRQITVGAVGWLESELQKWVKERAAQGGGYAQPQAA